MKLLPAAAVLLLFLNAPSLWASGLVNAFSLELVRLWTPDTPALSQPSCIPSSDAETLQRMQTWLDQASGHDPHLALHQGELACLRGNIQQTEEAWRQGDDQPISSLFAAIVSFSKSQVIKTPFSMEIGKYGYLHGLQARRENDISEAIQWYIFSLSYAPSINTANQLEYLYRSQGDLAQAQDLWLKLTQTVSSDIPLYWWAKGQVAARESNWAAAADFYYQSAIRADAAEAYRAFVQAGMMWYRSKEYDRAGDAFQQALALELDYVKADLDESLPYLWLGKVAQAQMKYEEALDYFTQAVILNPTSSGALYEKAVTLDSLGRRLEAIDTLEEAIVNDQNPPEQWKSLLENWKKCPTYDMDPNCR